MGNVLSTNAYYFFSWVKLALFTAYTHSVASEYFALSRRQLVCHYHAHCVTHMDKANQRYMRAAHAWAHFIFGATLQSLLA